MPSINSPLGAKPSRFKRQRVLVVGCGDIGLRAARLLHARVRLLALTSSPERMRMLREVGMTPILADLDAPESLRRFAGLATRVLHLAPPARREAHGKGAVWRDARTLALVRALRLRSLPSALVYGATGGGDGDGGGARVVETRT
ncbi:MAG: NAD-binding protein, partial [Variovorax sp.]